jgi:tetratricopeptide (TPR) repeat protein
LVVLVLLAAIVGAAAADPLADPTDPAALEHLKQGNRHLDLDHYDEAIKEFEAGALVEPAPIFWLNIGIAHQNAGRHTAAARAYRTLLAKIGDDPEAADLRDQVEEVIQAMEDAASRTTDPAPAPIVTGRDQPQRPASTFTTRRKIGLGLGIGGLVAVGAGVAFGLRAKKLEGDAADLCPEVACDRPAEANTLLERGQTNARYANIAYGLGAAAVVSAVVLWFTGAPIDQQANGTAVVLSGTFNGIMVSTRF